MSFIKEQGIQPTNNEYVFSEKEILTLIQTYIEKEIDLKVALYISADDDLDDEDFDDNFSVELELFYEEFCETEATEDQLYTLFEEWEMELYGCNKVLAEMFGYEEEEMELKYDIKNKRYLIKILTGNDVEIKVKKLQLSDRHVKSMKDHGGDYVDDVEELAEDWLEMKRTLQWVKEHSSDEKIVKRIGKLFDY